ncbi:conjugative transposon protein TraM [Niabella insulamsoli]|uniref:conjugative transposon protein TraM n=1 Tax=Niabella insulamsoli TaxID=3144874 RepID=UPI0031FCA767
MAVKENDSAKDTQDPHDYPKNKIGKFKKPAIYVLMALAFSGCLYLIFNPSEEKQQADNVGLNDIVPQATGVNLQGSKQKAYEKEQFEQGEKQKRKALATLSDFWNESSKIKKTDSSLEVENNSQFINGQQRTDHKALNSYRDAQNTLASFYREDNSETQRLRNEVEALKQELSQSNDEPATNDIDRQLALMEKSYQMASRYFPAGVSKLHKQPEDSASEKITTVNELPILPAQKNVVSILPKADTDPEQIQSWIQNRNLRFFTVGSDQKARISKNSIRACVHEKQTIKGNDAVRIRLLEPATISGFTIPKGQLLIASPKIQNSRLQLTINSIEYEGNIIPVKIIAYDNDGQSGLNIPYSTERSALTDIVAGMGSNAGTNVTLNSTPGQQITADMSKSVVQGISGYFAKKVRTPKITLKAGLELLLISKK